MLADLSDLRLEQARVCGIEHTVNSGRENLEAAVKDWTDGVGARIGVEAIGIGEVVAQTVMSTARYGEVILLGSTRARATFDVTPMQLRIHFEAIKMIGALEWCWPQHATERTRDLDANYRQIAEWVAGGKLAVAPLMTHLAPPPPMPTLFDEPDDRNAPIARRMTKRLVEALTAARRAAELTVAGDGGAFGEAVISGVSANLCEALAQIIEPFPSLDIRVSWAQTRPMTTHGIVRFGQADSAQLREAACSLRERAPRPDVCLHGFVRILERREEAADGTIRLPYRDRRATAVGQGSLGANGIRVRG